MSQLSIYLPPFASDYSGACSCLFDLDSLTIINDASCCTSHYVYYDEPRWEKKVKPVFCTCLRNIDAVLGNDEKIIEEICQIAGSIDTEMISIVGTPVPAITGMDIEGIAAEIEYRTGKPVFGFNTTGFNYYERGIYKAGKALIDRFAVKKDIVPGSVNIVGMTPLDFGDKGRERMLSDHIKAAGQTVACSFFMGMTKEQIENCAAAEKNIAVSSAGVHICRYLAKKFGTPYTALIECGEALPIPVEKLAQTLRENDSLLIVGDQVIANSARKLLLLKRPELRVTVASFFGFDAELAEEGDLHISDEYSFIKLVNSGRFTAICADPLFKEVPQCAALAFTEAVHPAVSSFLFKDR